MDPNTDEDVLYYTAGFLDGGKITGEFTVGQLYLCKLLIFVD